MRIVLTGGGTAGHVLPNIAIIEKIRKQEISYIGEKNSVEERLIKEQGINFYGIHAGKFRRYFDWRTIFDIAKAPLGFFEALVILKKIKPEIIFAKGGYVSVPVAFAARALKIPVWLHESDVSPGLANRIISRFAKKIWLSFEESRRFFEKKNVEVVGNPIRDWIAEGSRELGYKLTGFNEKKPVVLIIGGSSGALVLNKLVYKILNELLEKTQVIHITGGVGHGVEDKKHQAYRAFTYLEEGLAQGYAIADLIVSRAGSGAIFEALAVKKPLLLIPLPASASRGDQIENAEVCVKHGWALSLDQDTLTPKDFLQQILEFLHDEKLRANIVKNQQAAHFQNAAQKIATALTSIGNL